jgi:hypothetical protein
MQKPPSSTTIYVILIVVLAVLGGVNIFLPQGSFTATVSADQLPASKPVMALATGGMLLIGYGGLGYLGLRLAQRLGFPALWDPELSHRQRWLVPALVGAATGLFFVVADALLRPLHGSGPLPHPPFPTSIVASTTAAIGEELVFRLFFIPLWMWLISTLLLRGRWQNGVFWIVAVLSALAFALGHLPAVMLTLGIDQVSDVPIALMAEIVLLNGVLSLLAAHYFRRYGFLAAVGIHFWADVVWHVLWGLIVA